MNYLPGSHLEINLPGNNGTSTPNVTFLKINSKGMIEQGDALLKGKGF